MEIYISFIEYFSPGKTSLISQLLYDSVPEEHIPTVEEMYR